MNEMQIDLLSHGTEDSTAQAVPNSSDCYGTLLPQRGLAWADIKMCLHSSKERKYVQSGMADILQDVDVPLGGFYMAFCGACG
jgi:hypothetical protein